MSNRKLAAIVIAFVLGVGASVVWYLAGEQVAAREKAEATPPSAVTSFACPPAPVASGARCVRPRSDAPLRRS
jgi:hypothetical protein